MPITVVCIECGAESRVRPARADTFKFCSYACRGVWRGKHWAGENHPQWTGGERIKTCAHCGESFSYKRGSTVTTFRKQRFCSKACGDAGGIRYSGPDNWKWTGEPKDPRNKSKQKAWSKAVINRDRATCQHCDARDVELHAHHIKSHKRFPELRWDIANGLTLCHCCHWHLHAALDENGVNSGNTAAGKAAGNPEPSSDRKVLEGVTTRGRAYRRIEAECASCHAYICRSVSDMKGKSRYFCNYRCAGDWRRREYAAKRAHGSNASTSAPPERDDIVWPHATSMRSRS